MADEYRIPPADIEARVRRAYWRYARRALAEWVRWVRSSSSLQGLTRRSVRPRVRSDGCMEPRVKPGADA
jgi:hypothetical protein